MSLGKIINSLSDYLVPQLKASTNEITETWEKRFYITGRYMANFRDAFCEGLKDAESAFGGFGNVNTENWSGSEYISVLEYARRSLGKVESVVCNRGQAGGYTGYGALPADEKGFTLDKTLWGLISTDTLPFCQFIIDAAHINSIGAPVDISVKTTTEKDNVEEGETPFEEWPEDKKVEFQERLDACLDSFHMRKDMETGVYLLNYARYGGEIKDLEEICISAMKMVIPPQKAEAKGPSTDAPYYPYWGEQKAETEPKAVANLRDYIKMALAKNPPTLWVRLVEFCGPEVEGYSWVPKAKKAFHYALYGGGAAIAIRLLLRFEIMRRAFKAVSDASGLSWVGRNLKKLWHKTKPPRGPKGGKGTSDKGAPEKTDTPPQPESKDGPKRIVALDSNKKPDFLTVPQFAPEPSLAWRLLYGLAAGTGAALTAGGEKSLKNLPVWLKPVGIPLLGAGIYLGTIGSADAKDKAEPEPSFFDDLGCKIFGCLY